MRKEEMVIKKEKIKSKNSNSKNTRTMMYYIKKEWLGMSCYVFFSVLFYVADIFATILVADFLDKISLLQYTEGLKLIVLSGVLLIIGNIINWIGVKIMVASIGKMILRVRVDLSERSFKLSSKTFSDTSTGVYISRITSDPENAFWALEKIMDGFSNIFATLFTSVYVIILNVYIGLFFVVGLLGLGLMEIFRLKNWRKNKKIERKEAEKVASHTNEIVRSEKDIKALNLQGPLNEVSNQTYQSYRNSELKMMNNNINFWNARNLILSIFSLGIVLIGLFMLKNEALTLAAFLFIFLNRSSLRQTIWYIGFLGDAFSTLKVSSKRMFEIFDDKLFAPEKFGNVNLQNCTGTIEFNKVKFSYSEKESIKEEQLDKGKKKNNKSKKANEKIIKTKVFEDLSFKIKPNATVAFVGESGSGKSTILNLISKIYDTNRGNVLIDGIDIKKLSKETLRGNITLVNQFPYIFDKTIRENLLLAKSDATEEELIEACKKASFWEFVETHPKGLDTKVGESGIKLSGGQKQRLAIARAMLRKTKIILFDESTSSLDNFSQAEVKKSIDELSKNSTVVIVAHRLSTIKNADRIYFLDKGKIIGSGTFDELYKTNDKFQKLFTTEVI